MENTALREVLESWNFWNKPLTSQEIGFIRTDYIKEIKSFISLREIVTLKGIRRSGKSTLMYQTINELLKEGSKPEEMLYINFEDYRLTSYLSVNLLEQIYQLYREQINPEGFAFFFLDEIQNIPEFERWLRTYYDQKKDMKFFISGLINIAKLQKLSTNTVIEILRLLQNAYLLFSVTHFGYSTKEKINLQRPRKIYCSDLGMQNALTFSTTEDIGKKIENVIFQNFKYKKEVYYWKELNEVDFIYGKKGIPIEVTYTDTITEKEIKGVLAFLEKYNRNEGFVISNDKFDTLRFKNKTIRTIPLWVWLLI